MNANPQSEFAMLYIKNQSRVYAFIATLIPNRSDAEDLLQRTSMILWQKWDEYDHQRGFLPWARGIAMNEIRNHVRRSEQKNVYLSEAMISTLAGELEEEQETERVEALEHCLERLESRQRSLVEQCYLESMGAEPVANSLGVSRDAVYMRLHRIRRSLVNCIQRQLSCELNPQWEGAS